MLPLYFPVLSSLKWKILKENTRPPDLPLEKPVCMSGSNS